MVGDDRGLVLIIYFTSEEKNNEKRGLNKLSGVVKGSRVKKKKKKHNEIDRQGVSSASIEYIFLLFRIVCFPLPVWN